MLRGRSSLPESHSRQKFQAGIGRRAKAMEHLKEAASRWQGAGVTASRLGRGMGGAQDGTDLRRRRLIEG